MKPIFLNKSAKKRAEVEAAKKWILTDGISLEVRYSTEAEALDVLSTLRLDTMAKAPCRRNRLHIIKED